MSWSRHCHVGTSAMPFELVIPSLAASFRDVFRERDRDAAPMLADPLVGTDRRRRARVGGLARCSVSSPALVTTAPAWIVARLDAFTSVTRSPRRR